MTVKTIGYYEVGDAYDAEGKGPYTVIARFTNEHEAYRYSLNKGNYGRDAQVTHKKITLVDTVEEMDSYKQEEQRQKALAKLTEKEKELLGLK